MLKFFEPEEELPETQKQRVRNQRLDDVTKQYDHNFGNCILACTHKKKSNRNVYIPGIIRAGLSYTMPLILPSGLRATDPSASILNS